MCAKNYGGTHISKIFDYAHYLCSALRIKCGCRLIKNKQVGMVKYCRRYAEPLIHTSGIAFNSAFSALSHSYYIDNFIYTFFLVVLIGTARSDIIKIFIAVHICKH